MTAHLVVQTVLAFIVAALVITTLKLLRQFDIAMPSYGARRVQLRKRIGDSLALHLLPDALRDSLTSGASLLVFLSTDCPLCANVAGGLNALARAYPEVKFFACSDQDLGEFSLPSRRVLMLNSPQLVEDVGIWMWPYALRLQHGKIAECGVISTPEHLESLLMVRPHS